MTKFVPRNKVQKLAYDKWGVEDAEAFAAKVSKHVKRGTARTVWLAGSPVHKPDVLKAVADLLGTTIDDLFYN